MLRDRIKWFLFPGLNLHARLRYRELPAYFGSSNRERERMVLDAGCGNGMLSYQSYLLGNRVLGVSIKDEVIRARRLFNEQLGIPTSLLEFRDHNLYDIESLGLFFDEIICCEVLEHIKRDEQVVRSFFKILNPGGVLHVCCPNAAHPHHANYPLDPDETGGHVRPGYTYEAYQKLLTPIGFELSPPVGLGGPLRQVCNKYITRSQEIAGIPAGFVLFAISLPLVAACDPISGKVPYSLYVRARKPLGSSGESPQS